MASVIDRDLGQKRIFEEFRKLKGGRKVKVGVLSSAGGDLASVATWNEFGTSRGIPARPFMAQTFANKNREISDFIDKQKSAVISGSTTFDGALEMIGERYKGFIQKEIAAGGFAPNAPSTLAKKAPKTKPLIDTGQLRESINWEIFE